MFLYNVAYIIHELFLRNIFTLFLEDICQSYFEKYTVKIMISR